MSEKILNENIASVSTFYVKTTDENGNDIYQPVKIALAWDIVEIEDEKNK